MLCIFWVWHCHSSDKSHLSYAAKLNRTITINKVWKTWKCHGKKSCQEKLLIANFTFAVMPLFWGSMRACVFCAIKYGYVNCILGCNAAKSCGNSQCLKSGHPE